MRPAAWERGGARAPLAAACPTHFPYPTPPLTLNPPPLFLFPPRSAAEAELAAEAGKAAAGKTSSEEGEAPERTASGKPLSRTASGKVVGVLKRTASQMSMAADSIKNSKAGQAIARNRVFKWLTYGEGQAAGRGAVGWFRVRWGTGHGELTGERGGMPRRRCYRPLDQFGQPLHPARCSPLLACPPAMPTCAGITYDMHCVLDVDNEKHNQIAEDIWANAEVFDWRAETVFKYIQVRAG